MVRFSDLIFYLSIVEKSGTGAELNVSIGNDASAIEALTNGALHHVHKISLGQGEPELIPVHISVLLTVAIAVIYTRLISMAG